MHWNSLAGIRANNGEDALLTCCLVPFVPGRPGRGANRCLKEGFLRNRTLCKAYIGYRCYCKYPTAEREV